MDAHTPQSINESMSDVAHMAELVDVAPQSTVSRTILRAEGVRLVLFGFDEGEELSEHTAAMPVLLQALDGRFDVTATGRTVTLVPGGVIHLGTRTPHSVLALEPGRLLLTMLADRSVPR